MANFRIIKISTMWSTDKLTSDVERTLKEKSEEGYEIVSVAFGVNLWWMPTAFITLKITA
jgi:hypothetical protein